MRKVSVLFSAGVESSSLLLHYLDRNALTFPIYIKCGFPWERVELFWAERLWAFLKKRYRNLRPLRIISSQGIAPHNNSIEMPLRNLILLLNSVIESTRKGVRELAIGSLGIYPFPDNNKEFFSLLGTLLTDFGGIDFRIDTPFMGMTKEEVIGSFHGRVPYNLTFSCMHPKGKLHCGQCEKCLERKEGFREAGVPDPTCYLS